jgi:hypothetical protein
VTDTTTWVYVSGPLTTGGPAKLHENVRRAVAAACTLIERGYVAVVPHEKALLCERMLDLPYEGWLAYDLKVIDRCDVLLRLPGESGGADREVEYMKQLGRPVYFSLDTLFACEPADRYGGAVRLSTKGFYGIFGEGRKAL